MGRPHRHPDIPSAMPPGSGRLLRAMLTAVILLTLYACSLLDRGDFLEKADEILYGNTPPTVVVGTDFGVTTGNTAILDGSGSFDGDGDPISYQWSFSGLPALSGLTDASISNRLTSVASFVPDVDGTYILELMVDDAEDFSLGTLNVFASTTNTPPVADAGTDQSGFVNTTATLNGAGSSDADLDPLTYSWTFTTVPGGSLLTDANITGSTGSTPSFVPDVAGTYTLELTVNDGTATSTDGVNVAANDPVLVGEWLFDTGTTVDTGPFGNDGVPGTGTFPGADRAGNPGLGYFFDGTNGAQISVADNASLNFTDALSLVFWVRPDDIAGDRRVFSKRNNIPASGWEIYITDSGGARMVFMANGSVIGDAPMSGTTNGDWAHIAVTWCPGDPADQLKFYHNGVQVGTVTDSTAMTVSSTDFYIGRPGYASVLNFLGGIDDARLYHGIISAGEISALYSAVTVNTPPTADAGINFSGIVGTSAFLDGTASNDPNPADTLNYHWSFSSVPGGSLLTDGDISDANTATPYFVPDVLGNYQLQLAVDDGSANDTSSMIFSATVSGPPLVGEWMFSESQLNDTSPFGSTALANGAVPTSDRYGNPGAAYLFDGASSNLVLGNGPQLNYTDLMSFSCWFRADDINTDYGRLISNRNTSPTEGWELSLGTGDSISTNRAGVQSSINTGPGIIQGAWHHLVFTWDPNAATEQIKFYLDGVFLTGTSLYGEASIEPPVSSLPLTLGASAYFANEFMGAIDDVRFYHGILTASDVSALFAEPPVP